MSYLEFLESTSKLFSTTNHKSTDVSVQKGILLDHQNFKLSPISLRILCDFIIAHNINLNKEIDE